MTEEHLTDNDLAVLAEHGPERVDRNMVEHVAECGDCRDALMMISDVRAEMNEADNVVDGDFGEGRKWWKVFASAAALAAALFIVFGAPLRERWFGPSGTELLAEASKSVPKRATEGRLSGFPFQERQTMRGGDKPEEDDFSLLQVEAAAAKVLRDATADPHGAGVAYLVRDGRARGGTEPVVLLEKALAKATPEERPAVANDLAVALIARGGDADLERAIELTKDLKTPEAAFNRSKALEFLGRDREALAAYDAYLEIEQDPQWMAEAQKSRRMLLQLNPELGRP
jgi:hypothetical protein